MKIKIIKRLKKTLFVKVFDAIKKNPRLFFASIGLDIVFWIAALLFALISNAAVRFVTASQNIAAALLSSLIYILALILIYSFTKYSALNTVRNMFKKSKYDIEEARRLYILNLLITFASFLVLAVIGVIISRSIRPELASTVGLAVFTLYSVMLFSLIGNTHSLFAASPGLANIFKKGLTRTFKSIRSYYGVIIVNVVALGIYYASYLVIGKSFNFLFKLNIERYNNLFITLIFLLVILLQAFNRIYFYLVCKK